MIYTDKSWRSLQYADEISVGSEIRIFTDKGFSNIFEVGEKMVLPIGKNFIVNKSESRQILLLVEDTDNSRYYGFSLISKR